MVLMLAAAVTPAPSYGRQGGAPAPVPPSAFKGKTLIAPDLGFSIESPGPKWTWTKSVNPAAKLVQFNATSPDTGERFTVMVLQPDAPRPLDKAEADGFAAGVAEAQGRQGNKVGPRSCAPWAGMQGGWRCAFPMETAQKEQVQFVGYVVSTKRFYAVQYFNVGSGEPPPFKTFAAALPVMVSPAFVPVTFSTSV